MRKLKIKYKMLADIPEPLLIEQGDWIDLRAAVDVDIEGPLVTRSKKDSQRTVVFNDIMLPLGIAMELPKGFEAIVDPRSGIFKRKRCILANSQGVIDNSYNGDTDEWKAHLIPFGPLHISKGERIMQFRIQLSQKATFRQKLNWLFSSGVELIAVNELGHPDRGGYGSTGVK